MFFAVLQSSCTIMIMPGVVISCADWSFTLTWCFQSWKSPASFLLLHAVGLQLKRHWHVNAAGRFFLASRQGLGSSLITQCSPLFRSSCLLVLFLKISYSFSSWYLSLVCLTYFDSIHSLRTTCSPCYLFTDSLCLLVQMLILLVCFVKWLKVGFSYSQAD